MCRIGDVFISPFGESMENFRKLGLDDVTIDALVSNGFTEPTPVQSKIIPLMFNEKNDLVGQAETGSGKTAAFALPVLQETDPKSGNVEALILTPTRELAVQIACEFDKLKGKRKVDILPVYGGKNFREQLKALQKGVTVVVGTPGRLIDHINRGTLDLSHVKYMVLDEADEMLNMGFIEDVETIMSSVASDKRTLLFSATMPRPVQVLAKRFMKKLIHVKLNTSKMTSAKNKHFYHLVYERDKVELLARVLEYHYDFYGIVFCRTRLETREIAAELRKRNFAAASLQGEMDQNERERTMERFRKKNIQILVATDIAARGIDVSDLSHVVNFTTPQNPEAYVHRTGRTGRAGKEGVAITFVTPDHLDKIHMISRVIKTDIVRQPFPSTDELIKNKWNGIRAFLERIAAEPAPEEAEMLAKEILNREDPLAIVASLIDYKFGKKLKATSFAHIEEPTRTKRSKPDFNRKRKRSNDSRKFSEPRERHKHSSGKPKSKKYSKQHS